MSRALRRAHHRRMQQKVIRQYRRHGVEDFLTPRRLGIMVSTHRCRRKDTYERTLRRDVRALEDAQFQLDEAGIHRASL